MSHGLPQEENVKRKAEEERKRKREADGDADADGEEGATGRLQPGGAEECRRPASAVLCASIAVTALTAAAEPETLVDTVDDEREYYRQEVGEEPDEGTALDRCILE